MEQQLPQKGDQFRRLFSRFDEYCAKLRLSDCDRAVLLDVTPAMVSRYRQGKARIPQCKHSKFRTAVEILATTKDQAAKLKGAQRTAYFAAARRDLFPPAGSASE